MSSDLTLPVVLDLVQWQVMTVQCCAAGRTKLLYRSVKIMEFAYKLWQILCMNYGSNYGNLINPVS